MEEDEDVGGVVAGFRQDFWVFAFSISSFFRFSSSSNFCFSFRCLFVSFLNFELDWVVVVVFDWDAFVAYKQNVLPQIFFDNQNLTFSR